MNIAGIYYQDAGLQALYSDGLLGLSPNKIDDQRPDLFVNVAFEQGAIDEKVFSLYFAGDFDLSYFTVGGYDVEEFAVEDVTWHKNKGHDFWSVSLEGVQYGQGEDALIYEGHVSAVVDSGSSYILMPESNFWDFCYEMIDANEELSCEFDFWGSIYCIYDEEIIATLPELFLTIEGKEYKVPRESLYTPIEDYWGNVEMTVEVMYISGWDEWILGLTFLENYYAVYDMDNDAIGFAVSKTSKLAQ